MEFWLSIIIPSGISIIGFCVTIYMNNKQFKNAKKERIAEKQRELYLKCYKQIEPIINSPNLIFDFSYYQNIVSLKPEMKLFASNSTLRSFKDYLQFVYVTYEEYRSFYQEHDPFADKNNIEMTNNTETGEECEIYHVNEVEGTNFRLLIEKYCEEHCPNSTNIGKKIKKLLNAMRKDLSNDSVKRDVIT